MKAYILSEEHGTVQIGSTVFQPCTGARFRVTDRKGISGRKSYTVSRATMGEAEIALIAHKRAMEVGR